tara:strand:- start:193 stop:390 length:198 start_codon:yes stop_codon:yes gene_type:complete
VAPQNFRGQRQNSSKKGNNALCSLRERERERGKEEGKREREREREREKGKTTELENRERVLSARE